MMVTNFHIDNAKRRAAEARRYVEDMRQRIAGLRRCGADTSAEEARLETAVVVIERFEAYVETMHLAAGSQKAHGA